MYRVEPRMFTGISLFRNYGKLHRMTDKRRKGINHQPHMEMCAVVGGCSNLMRNTSPICYITTGSHLPQ